MLSMTHPGAKFSQVQAILGMIALKQVTIEINIILFHVQLSFCKKLFANTTFSPGLNAGIPR